MGGSIAIAARFADGSAICVEGWTNFLDAMIMNPTTLSGDDAIVRSMLGKAAASPDYAGAIPLRPSGYGIVTIDFVTREIHSMQGYTSFGPTRPNELLDLMATNWKDGECIPVLSSRAEALIKAGRVRLAATEETAHDPVALDGSTVLDLARNQMIPSDATSPRSVVHLTIDVSPFVVHDDEDAGFAPIRRRLKSAGFPMDRAAGLNAGLPTRRRTRRP